MKENPASLGWELHVGPESAPGNAARSPHHREMINNPVAETSSPQPFAYPQVFANLQPTLPAHLAHPLAYFPAGNLRPPTQSRQLADGGG